MARVSSRAKGYKEVDIPVIDGTAYLPDGRTIESTAQVVRVPVLPGNRLYERIQKFRASAEVSPQAYRADPAIIEEVAAKTIAHRLSGELRGSRGGRYVPFGPTVFQGIGEVDDDFIRNRMTATGWRMARYVRPGGA